MPWSPPVPTFDAGVRDLVATMREPAYLKLLGKAAGAAFGTGLIIRRLPPQVAMPMVLMTGIYIGLEMAAWMEEEAASHKGPMIDATAEAAAPAEATTTAGYTLPEAGD
jgi:hypothetical protein